VVPGLAKTFVAPTSSRYLTNVATFAVRYAF